MDTAVPAGFLAVRGLFSACVRAHTHARTHADTRALSGRGGARSCERTRALTHALLGVRVNVCNGRGGAPAGVRVTRSNIRASALRVDRRMRISYAPFRLRLIFITSFNSCVQFLVFLFIFCFVFKFTFFRFFCCVFYGRYCSATGGSSGWIFYANFTFFLLWIAPLPRAEIL